MGNSFFPLPGWVINPTSAIEFVFAIPTVYSVLADKSPRVSITTTSMTPVTATLTLWGDGNKTVVQTSRYQPANVILSPSFRINRGDGQQNRTIIVRASAEISVHVLDNDYGNYDGFIALDTQQLGTQYYSGVSRMAYPRGANRGRGFGAPGQIEE